MLVVRRLRHDWRRSAAMGATILFAVTAFIVLTGSARTSRLETTATVDEAFRPTYDLLVRPKGSRSTVEKATGRVRPNYLSGIFGGITLAQADTIAGLPGVAVSAPIAMLGQVFQTVSFPIDVSGVVGSSGPALLRFRTTERSMRGLASTPGSSGYVYVTDDPMSPDVRADDLPVVEQHDGRSIPVCRDMDQTDVTSPLDPLNYWSAQCWSRRGGLDGERWPGERGHVTLWAKFIFPVMLAAVDPAAEARLTGLDDAVTKGRYLAETEATTERATPGDTVVTVPVIASSTAVVDEMASIEVDRLDDATVRALRNGLTFQDAHRLIAAAPGERALTQQVDDRQIHQQWLYGAYGAAPSAQTGMIYPRMLFTTSPVTYQPQEDGALAPVPVPQDEAVWRTSLYVNEPFAALPPTASDTGYRTVTPIPALGPSAGAPMRVALSTVGEFALDRVDTGPELSRVPLETYQAPRAEPATKKTAELLTGQSLLPDTNPRGYLQSPPLLLTTIKAIDAFTNGQTFAYPAGSVIPRAPLSAIRIKVSGVGGPDAESRERIRLVAQQVRDKTGLDVDIMTGSSPHPTEVILPATAHGAPSLTVDEDWVDKGVATAVIEAIDRKSLALFTLVLLTSALSVAISATASVRTRRVQLGVLACLGWRPGTIVRSVLGELVLVGAAAGMAGSVLSLIAGTLPGIDVEWWRALVAVPGAVVIALAAGGLPALIAARSTPIDAVHPAVTTRRRATRLTGPASLARSYLLRTPGRAAAAALTIALAVAALTILVGIMTGFHDAVVGTLLGDAVAIQVRGVDIAAGLLVAVLALASLADILYLDLREQAPRYASLQAAGWRDRTLGMLIVHQALLVAAVGSIVGAGAGLAALAALATLHATVWATAAAICVAAIGLAALVALIPARSLRTLPTARLLAEE